MSKSPFLIFSGFGIPSGFIVYLCVPTSQQLSSADSILPKLQGVHSWEIDSPRSVYFLLEEWMTSARIRELYQALRGTYGPYIRFGAAGQKTTARAAALYRPVPHCTIITSEKTEQFLAELPIRLLPGLGDRTTKFLESRGVYTFTAFRNLPVRTLKQWFGVSGLILKQFAHGLDPRAVEPKSLSTVAVG